VKIGKGSVQKNARTDLDKDWGVDLEIGLCENGLDKSNKEREGKECSEHGCSAVWVGVEARRG